MGQRCLRRAKRQIGVGFRALAARTYPKGFGDKIPPNSVIGLILSGPYVARGVQTRQLV